MSSRYGPQPAREALREERWSISAAARRIGVEDSHLRHAVNGRTVPSPFVRESLSVLLNKSVEDLFTPEALAAEYNPGFGPGGKTRQLDPRFRGGAR